VDAHGDHRKAPADTEAYRVFQGITEAIEGVTGVGKYRYTQAARQVTDDLDRAGEEILSADLDGFLHGIAVLVEHVVAVRVIHRHVLERRRVVVTEDADAAIPAREEANLSGELAESRHQARADLAA